MPQNGLIDLFWDFNEPEMWTVSGHQTLIMAKELPFELFRGVDHIIAFSDDYIRAKLHWPHKGHTLSYSGPSEETSSFLNT